MGLDKMLRKKGVDEENEEKKGRESEKEKKSQPSNGNTSDSDTPTTITTSRPLEIENSQEKDTRKEVCQQCGEEWPHDVVSIVNMLNIVSCHLKGEKRPAWLCPKTREEKESSGK